MIATLPEQPEDNLSELTSALASLNERQQTHEFSLQDAIRYYYPLQEAYLSLKQVLVERLGEERRCSQRAAVIRNRIAHLV